MSTKRAPIAAIDWRAQIGSIQSRSTIAVAGSSVYVGTCGTVWNVRDKRDGVHCFDLETGEERWFTPTLSDVNEMALAGSDLIAPTDGGDVFVLDAHSGDIRYIVRADAAVLGKPIVYQTLGNWSAILASLSGTIYRIESESIELVTLGEIGGGLRANLVPLGYNAFIASGENGLVFKAHIERGQLISHPIAELPFSDYGGSPAITASPLVDGDVAFVGYVRDTYYDTPAVACINHQTGEIVWLAQKTELSFGNVRTTPALVDGKLVIASAYTDCVHFFDPATGVLIGQVKLGQRVFQQWSAPVPLGLSHIALGRVDGVCSIIDVRREKLVSSVSLATAETERLTGVNPGQFEDETFALYPNEPAPAGAICGTPAFDGRRLILGTTDGSLASVELDLSRNNLLH